MDILQCLKSFTTVVECSSFAAAAKRLSISSSKISKQITNLESELKTKLFIRSTKQIILTDKGQMLYEKVGNLFDELKEIKEIALQDLPMGLVTLKLCLTVSPAVLYLTNLTTQFMEANSGIAIELHIGSNIVDMYEYDFDLAITFDVIRQPNMICKKLFSVQRDIYASPEYLETHGYPATPEELINHNCLINTIYGLQNKWILNSQIIHVSGNFKSNNAEVLKEVALNGLGLIWVPYFSVREEVQAGKLLPVLPNDKSPEIMLYAIYKKHKRNNEYIDLFLQYLCEEIVRDGIIELD